MDEASVELEITDLIARSSLDMVLAALHDYCRVMADDEGAYTADQYDNVADLLNDCLHELEE